MEQNGPSSLDRFLWRRSQDMLDARSFRPASRGESALGWLQVLLGAGIVAFAIVGGGDALIVLLLIGSVLTTVGALTILSGAKKHQGGNLTTRPVVLPSQEGQRLLHKICTHIGYANYQDEIYGRSLAALRGHRTSAQIVKGELFDLLDSAAFQFNRIDGLLQERSTATDAGLRSLAPVSRAAALEAMAIVVNHAAWIDTFPENEDDHRRTIQERTVKLCELADRLSALCAAKPTLLETAASRSLMDDVLDKLMLEEDARSELIIEDNGKENFV